MNHSLHTTSRLAASALALGAVLAADPALAQITEADEIVVTARRTQETLIEAPVAVSAFSEESIEDLGIQSIDDIARFTPGFSFSNAFGRTTERPVIRGAANILAGVQFGVEAGAAYFVDGVYYSGSLQALDIRNVERVEVVKGPQSALYGRNTYSGAINFVTKRPSAGGFEGSAEAIYAEDDEVQLYGRLSQSFADGRMGVSVSGRYYEYGGDSAWENAAAGGAQMGEEQSLNLNATVDLRSDAGTTAVIRAGYTEDDDGPRPFRLIGAEQNNCFPGYRSGAYYSPNPFPFPTPFGGLYPDTPTTDFNFQYFCGDLSQFEDLAPAQDLDGVPFIGVEREMVFVTGLFEQPLPNDWEVSLSAGFRSEELLTGSDSDHQPGSVFGIGISPFFSIPTADAFLNTTDESEIDDLSLEVRLASDPGRRVRGSVGAYYYDFTNDGRSGSLGRVSTGDPLGLQRSNTQTIENVALFGTLDIDVSDQLTLSGELRYQDETKGREEFGGGAAAPTYNEEVSFDDVVYKAIASFDVNADASAYASYAFGVKPGGVNGPDGLVDNAEFYAPEEVDAFEIGFKSRLLDNRARFSVAGYFNDISQYQLTTPVAASAGSNVNSVATNQGNAEILGFEFEGSFDLSEYMRLGASYAYTDAEFTSGCDDFQFTLNTGGYLIAAFDRTDPPTTGTIRGSADPLDPAFDPDGLFTGNLSCDITGNRVPLTSEHQGAVFVQTEFPLGDSLSGFLNADLTHESSKFVQVHNQMETGDATILSGQIGVQFADVRLEIFGRNLLDERTPPAATRWFDLLEGFNTISSRVPGATSVDRTVVGPRSTFLSYRRGRQIGARLKVDF